MIFPRSALFWALFLLILAGGAFAAFEFRNRPVEAGITARAARERVAQLEGDRDSDGLKDWEEALWNTDPENPDTDGDKTPDGEEVRSGRDPARAGPGDELPSGAAEGGGEPISATDRVAREFFARYLALKEAGVALDKELALEVARTSLKSAVGEFSPAAAKPEDFSVSADTPAAIRAYGNAVGRSLRVRSPSDLENELAIFGRALREKRPGELAKLDPLIAGYRGIGEDLVKIAAPRDALAAHAELATSVGRLAALIGALRAAFTDPVAAASAVNAYPAAVSALGNALAKLDAFFLRHRIVFGENEDGSLIAASIY